MSGTNHTGALDHLRDRFAAWRRHRTRGSRIPEPLWRAAAQTAREHGVHKTSKRVGIDYYSLKRRMTRPVANQPRAMEFVEIPQPVLASVPGCVLELQDRDGLRLRIELRDTAGAETLARSLWRERR